MKELSPRQTEIAALVARGLSDKLIAARTELAIETVRVHIQNAAARVGGKGTPRHILTLWFFNIVDEEKAG